jgi:hypothetical protein
MGSSRCRSAITIPDGVRPVTSSSAGTEPDSTASEWYRVAVNGEGSPASTPTPSWTTWLVLPCSSSGARTTTPPKASAMAWCPRQTPSTGSPASAAARTIGTVTPASTGVPGPGDSSTPATSRSASSAVVTASLRRTTQGTPSWPRYWTRL